jgi:hypothetical protein
MTIVAALRIEGIPALIGDFLITDEQYGTDHFWLPTRPNLNDPRYPKLPRRISGLRRKLHLINERFVVGFTGAVDAGAVIFADLERRFRTSNKSPSIKEISRALEQFNVLFDRRATVVGWTCGSRPRCFRWSARPGSSATHEPYAIEGSGSHHFADLLTKADVSGYSPEVKIAFEKSVLLGLSTVGAVLTEELSTGANLRASYGSGAEIVLYTGNRFEFVSKIGYAFLNVRIELNGSITIMPSNVSVVYEARERYCLLQVTQYSLTEKGLKAENTYLQAFTPLHDDMTQLVLTGADEVTPECSYYFNGIAFLDTRTNRSGTLQIGGISSGDLWFRVLKRGDKLYSFQWDHRMLQDMILFAASRATPAASQKLAD